MLQFEVNRFTITPQAFEIVEVTCLVMHDVNDEITVVEQHPLRLLDALPTAAYGLHP